MELQHVQKFFVRFVTQVAGGILLKMRKYFEAMSNIF